jgi:vacuolar-type H+-ATPase catalytic subunit A/Vma1
MKINDKNETVTYKQAVEEIASIINVASMNPKDNWTFEAVVNLAQAMGDIANKSIEQKIESRAIIHPDGRSFVIEGVIDSGSYFFDIA